MQTLRFLTLALFVVGVLVFAPGAVMGQDAAKVAPNIVKVLLDNAKVRVLDFQLKKGDRIAMHSHPAQVIYAVTTGKTKTTLPDGKTSETEFKAGEARWSDPVTHANEALTDVHVVVIELKESMKMEKKVEEKMEKK